MNWESTFKSWASPPSKTEQQKCDNAAGQISKAIDASDKLRDYQIKVFAQGSYRNHTNVRNDSDVDICILCTSVFFVDYSFSEGLTDADVGLRGHSYTYAMFKNDVQAALNSYFGANNVTRGNKAFDIHENSYRVDADVVACFEHRRYMGKPNGGFWYNSGTELHPDNGGKIINWPNQNYENGVLKNNKTQRGFKAGVRIIKCLRNKMDENGIRAAEPIPSFLLECMAWNVPDNGYLHDSYAADIRYALAHLFNGTITYDRCKEWGEINELKYLFRNSQNWTRDQAHQFLGAAWDYLEFK